MPRLRDILNLTLIALLLAGLAGSIVSLRAAPAAQGDGLNLPTELYTLNNAGQLERYGLGASGVATVTPDAEVVVDFGVAPDGIWLAYRTEAALNFRNVLTDETRLVESGTSSLPPFRGRGATLAWSPDAGVLAYTVEYGLRSYFNDGSNVFFDLPISPLLNLLWSADGSFLAAEAENNIWWIYRRDNAARQLVLTSAIPSSVGLAWVGNSLLMFAPETGGLFLMDVGNGNAQSQIADETLLFRQPAYRRDGTVAIFARPANDDAVAPTEGYLYRVTPSSEIENIGVEAVSQVKVDLAVLRWSPGGNLMLALQGGVLGLIDPATGQGFALPVTGIVSYGWGALRPPTVATVPLTAAGYFLADDGTGIDQLWRLTADGSQAVPVLFAEQSVTAFDVADDGETIVYHSGGVLWLLPAGVDTASPLLEIEAVSGLAFSPDQQAVIYTADETIYTLPLTGGEPTVILSGYSEPQYAPDGSVLLVRINDGDLALYFPASGEVRRLGAFTRAKWFTPTLIGVYGAPLAGNPPALYVLDLTGDGTPRLLYSLPASAALLDFALVGTDRLRLLQATRTAGPAPVELIDIPLAGGEITPVGSAGFIGQPQLDPEGQVIAGYASAAGTLLLHDLSSGAEVALSLPPGVKHFIWR